MNVPCKNRFKNQPLLTLPSIIILKRKFYWRRIYIGINEKHTNSHHLRNWFQNITHICFLITVNTKVYQYFKICQRTSIRKYINTLQSTLWKCLIETSYHYHQDLFDNDFLNGLLSFVCLIIYLAFVNEYAKLYFV